MMHSIPHLPVILLWVGLLLSFVAVWGWVDSDDRSARLIAPTEGRLWQRYSLRGQVILALYALLMLTVGTAGAWFYHYHSARPAPHASAPRLVAVPKTPGPTREQREAALDQLKSDYENLFVLYYYLDRCGDAQITDFDLLYNNLIGKLHALNAGDAWADTILQAARGSYAELYATSPCEGAGLANSLTAYRRYLGLLQPTTH